MKSAVKLFDLNGLQCVVLKKAISSQVKPSYVQSNKNRRLKAWLH
ncbi:MAG: hypothetical protein ACTSU9_10740 [Promethearchaeota archaeon]